MRHLLAAPNIQALTLVGSGGVGKSRLALSLARRVLDRYADGAVWVELAPLADHTLVLPTVGRAVGLPDTGGTDITTSLRSALGDREVLIVLDTGAPPGRGAGPGRAAPGVPGASGRHDEQGPTPAPW